ncbi:MULTISPECIES: pilus (MSHA type) biogenesis protein MshL [Alteromonadaceae]|uniref:Pilus (MSHA type) biogenesis protein MshL n=1 Tax=Brumicola blandensis TaxID=3075611 RepID=A0AAW8QYT0_9ALTE|nr:MULTISPECIES: pilus (MSHA type) biogenesis protein MshL [unclassified Alteromonas]MDT0582236.1 pilus (MSHA type) biogenesis protein MshL [Alteromonas sp. W409]MDT0627808.1 pilus (MSHA type) biogenesis protein MshL [Alteromonas sp. W364]
MNSLRIGKALSLCFIAISMAGCQTTDNSHVEKSLAAELDAQLQVPEKKVEPELEAAVSDFLLAGDAPSKQSDMFIAEKYDINARQIDAVSFFSGLVKDTPFSVAIHPEVTGLISLDLKQVELDTIFELVSDLYGFHIDRTGNVYKVFPAGMRTETFSVNYLLMQRDGNTQTSIISGGVAQAGNNQNGNNNNQNGGFNNFSGNSQVGNNLGGNSFGNNGNGSNGTSITTRTETNFWENLETSLKDMLGNEKGRSVMVSPQAGLVTVRALPDEIKTIRNFLNISEESLQRQVIIEARILEVVLNDEYQQGINWNQVLAHAGSTDLGFSTSVANLGNEITASLGGITSLSFLNKDFSGVVNLLDTQGNVQVLSSPRVTAINNQKAVIKVGDDEYFVTDVSSQSTISNSSTSVSPDIGLTPFFSGIALDVTPQIDENGSILLHIHPSVIETEEQEKVITLNEEQYILPLAQSTIRESDTIIRASSGEIVVIGGLMQSVVTNEESKIPLLGDIPFMGNLFKNKREKETKKELIILLKPTVVGENTWRTQIEASRSQMADWLYVE